MIDEKKMRHALNYRMGFSQFMEQARRADIHMEKVRAAIIMQAWINGQSVYENMDEIVIS